MRTVSLTTSKISKGSFEQQNRAGFLLIIPLCIVFLGLVIYPLSSAIYMSFTNKLIGLPGKFIGLGNFITLLKDEVFQRTIVNNFTYTISSVSVKFVFGVFIALLLNQTFRGRSAVRGLLLLPWATPALVSALSWSWMFSDIGGVFSYILKSLHIIENPVAWLALPNTAMPAVILVSVWRGIPFYAISLLAGLQSIPKDLYEAAYIDGANRRKVFRHIEWPGLLSVSSVVLLLDLIWTFNEFVVVQVLTRGGPLNSTMLFSTLTYQLGISSLKLGQAAACSLMFLPFIVLLIFFTSRWMLKEEE